MATSTRIKGKSLVFEVDGTEYACDATSVVLANEEADDQDAVTFCDAATGASVQWYLEVSAITSTDSGSFWSFLWDNAGETDVSFVFAPHGNAVPTVTQPHFEGTVTLPSKPSIGGEANSTWTFDVRIDLDGEPTKRTAVGT